MNTFALLPVRAATAYNLTRAINILGTRTLCQALAI
jgi:hypothetical protein